MLNYIAIRDHISSIPELIDELTDDQLESLLNETVLRAEEYIRLAIRRINNYRCLFAWGSDITFRNNSIHGTLIDSSKSSVQIQGQALYRPGQQLQCSVNGNVTVTAIRPWEVWPIICTTNDTKEHFIYSLDGVGINNSKLMFLSEP